MRTRALFALIICVAPLAAPADSIEFGAATRCDSREGVFELAAVAQFNEQITVVASRLRGTRQLTYGRHELRCKVGRRLVTASVEVHPPSNGQCMGAGYVALNGFSTGARPTEDTESNRVEPFNFSCPGEEMLVSLLVRNRPDLRAVEIRRCVAKEWSWDSGYVNIKCADEYLR